MLLGMAAEIALPLPTKAASFIAETAETAAISAQNVGHLPSFVHNMGVPRWSRVDKEIAVPLAKAGQEGSTLSKELSKSSKLVDKLVDANTASTKMAGNEIGRAHV